VEEVWEGVVCRCTKDTRLRLHLADSSLPRAAAGRACTVATSTLVRVVVAVVVMAAAVAVVVMVVVLGVPLTVVLVAVGTVAAVPVPVVEAVEPARAHPKKGRTTRQQPATPPPPPPPPVQIGATTAGWSGSEGMPTQARPPHRRWQRMFARYLQTGLYWIVRCAF
jgi:hypothetical protein